MPSSCIYTNYWWNRGIFDTKKNEMQLIIGFVYEKCKYVRFCQIEVYMKVFHPYNKNIFESMFQRHCKSVWNYELNILEINMIICQCLFLGDFSSRAQQPCQNLT